MRCRNCLFRPPWLRLLLLGAAVAATSGCASLRYYGQALSGHLELISRAQPVDVVLQNGDLSAETRERLELARAIRRFASRELALPDNNSYKQYADLGRPYAVWNVVATPEFSIRPKRWCYFIVGCVSYRGFFDPEEARAEARILKAQGYDVYVGGSQAYSTLGWFDDPLLNTFINGAEEQLVNIIVHELAHQRLYVKHATAFNEAFATAVAREGVRRWLEKHGRPGAYRQWIASQQRSAEFNDLLITARERLHRLYGEPLPEAEKRRRKQAAFEELQEQYAQFKTRWNGYSGFDGWMRQGLNNAHLTLIATYREHVPAFEVLLARHGGDLQAFYRAAGRIGHLPPPDRDLALAALQEERLAPSVENVASPDDPETDPPLDS